MRTYKYRLTFTLKSGKQWRVGVEAELAAESIATDLGPKIANISNICLSDEKTGQVVWIRNKSEILR